jgi:hypothetical protein
MSDSQFDFSLDSLALVDDSELSYDSENYQDQVTSPAPPNKGIYRVVAQGFKPRTDKSGKPVVEDGKFPIFTIGVVNIIDGLGEGVERKVGIFADVKTKPFARFGTPVSGLGDFTRALGTPNWSGIEGGLAAVRDALESSTAFSIGLDWSVYDKDFIAAAIQQLEIPADKSARTDDEKKLLNAIYKVGRVEGQQYFPFNEDRGTFSHVLVRGNVTFINPVTNAPVTVDVDQRAMEARPFLSRFYSANDYASGKAKSGPAKVKAAVQKGVVA